MSTEKVQLTVGDLRIGEGHPCFIIAEAGVNHNGSLDMALKLVDVAKKAGADAVKFQKRNLSNLYPAELLADPNTAEWAFQYMLPILKNTELSEQDFIVIKKHCDDSGIRFMCTPWDEGSLEFLETLGVDIYKVASADLINFPLLTKIAATGKPMILSTGMVTGEEIAITVAFLKKLGASFALLHCVSTYPAPFENINLRYLETLKTHGVPVGYSGHERGISIPIAALAMGATIIEKHITMDRTLPGPDHPASLEPGGMEKLVRDIRNAELALGTNEKTLSAMEKLNRQLLGKSIVAARDLTAGTVITLEMVSVKGPGKGLSPQRITDLVGTILARDLKRDDYFTETDVVFRQAGMIPTDKLQKKWGLKARFHDLVEILDRKPRVVELHFSDTDVDHPFQPPVGRYEPQLIVHAPEFSEGRLLDLCSFDDEIRQKAIDLMQKTVDKAVSLQPHFTGPVSVVIHVGGMSMDEPIADRKGLLRRAVEAFRQIDAKGTILLPENLPPRPWYLGGQWTQNVFIRPEELVEFCQELDLGMTLDTSHAQLFCTWADYPLADFVKLCLPYTRHMHIADATGIDGEGVQIGEGVIDWENLMTLLKKEDFTWVPEIWSGHLQAGAGFVEAFNRLTRFGPF